MRAGLVSLRVMTRCASLDSAPRIKISSGWPLVAERPQLQLSRRSIRQFSYHPRRPVEGSDQPVQDAEGLAFIRWDRLHRLSQRTKSREGFSGWLRSPSTLFTSDQTILEDRILDRV